MNELKKLNQFGDNDVERVLFHILEGTFSTEELDFFKEWMKEEKNKEYFRQVKEVWNAVTVAAVSDEEKKEAFRRFSRYISTPRLGKWQWLRVYGKYVALVALVLGGWWFVREEGRQELKEMPVAVVRPLQQEGKKDGVLLTRADGSVVCLTEQDSLEPEADGTHLVHSMIGHLKYQKQGITSEIEIYNSVTVPRGERFHLILADGTKVWLNAESQLTYPVNFVGKERGVILSGQAYFEVSKDPDHPFIVRSGEMETRVLGTVFDVSNYPEEPQRVVLLEGSVKVSAYDRETILCPDQQAMVDVEGKQIAVEEVDARSLVQWKDGILYLEHLGFEEMLGKLSRWYGVVFVNQAIVSPHDRFNGKFYQEDIAEAMHVVSMSAKVDYRIQKDTIFIY